jgi:hypothetical protein
MVPIVKGARATATQKVLYRKNAFLYGTRYYWFGKLHAIAMKQYDVVRVAAIRADRFAGKQPQFQRHPQVGDVGTILEVYGDAFEG